MITGFANPEARPDLLVLHLSEVLGHRGRGGREAGGRACAFELTCLCAEGSPLPFLLQHPCGQLRTDATTTLATSYKDTNILGFFRVDNVTFVNKIQGQVTIKYTYKYKSGSS